MAISFYFTQFLCQKSYLAKNKNHFVWEEKSADAVIWSLWHCQFVAWPLKSKIVGNQNLTFFVAIVYIQKMRILSRKIRKQNKLTVWPVVSHLVLNSVTPCTRLCHTFYQTMYQTLSQLVPYYVTPCTRLCHALYQTLSHLRIRPAIPCTGTLRAGGWAKPSPMRVFSIYKKCNS